MDEHDDAPVGRPARGPASRRRLVAVLWATAVAVLVVDQATKALALRYLGEDETVPVVGELLELRLVFNPGAAFSIGTGLTWLLTAVSVVVVAAIARVSRRLGSRGWALALGLLLGGAVGNLVDRLARPPGFARGHVVDFIGYWDWFVGNVADIAIVAAAGLILVLGFRGVRVDGQREGAGDSEHEEAQGG